MHRSLREISHRPWALPKGPWVMAQNWHDLLFAHWPVPVSEMRRLVPHGLEVDEFGRQAWISVVPFTMSGVRLRGTPAVPWLSVFPELNVRTYVVAGGKPGVWFFSLDAGNSVAVQIARRWFHLPYFLARMNAIASRDQMKYSSRRDDRKARDARFVASYSGFGASFQAKPGTLEYFLTERYCLYAEKANGEILRGEIHHEPWSLQEANASIGVNTMAERLRIDLAAPPAVMHFTKLQEVVVWWPQKL
jgi:uncharacterized protein YqjF (DUF2071 family)